MPVKESDKFLTVLTEDLGRISVYGNGVRSLKSNFLSSVSPLCYDELVLYKKGEKYWLREAAVVESFPEIKSDLLKNALAGYFLDVLCDITFENDPDGGSDYLSLILNILYALSLDKWDIRQVKSVFEFRAIALAGMMPNPDCCEVCGKEIKSDCYLDLVGGEVICPGCRKEQVDSGMDIPEVRYLTPAAYKALSYVISCPPKRIMSFKLEERDLVSFADASESYLIAQLERSFNTLDFYKELSIPE